MVASESHEPVVPKDPHPNETLFFAQRGEMTHRGKPNLQRKRRFKEKIAIGANG